MLGLWQNLSSWATWAWDKVTFKKAPQIHTGAHPCAWTPFARAPKKFRGAVLAAAKAMADDFEVPVGLSRHTINGAVVEVHKPAPGHLAVIRYCSGG